MRESLLDCGHPPSPHESFTTGYGTDSSGKTFCYACCAETDKRSMIETGKATLYLTLDAVYVGHARGKVSNWPSSLEFPVRYVHEGRHNIAGKRYDIWFDGPDGSNWHGVQYGDNTQVCHCKRIKG